MKLADERCVPSRRGMPIPSADEIAALLGELDPTWAIADHALTRTWRFPDFATGLAFVNRVGAIADGEDHHPDVFLAWGRVRITLSTHAVGGLTRNDFVLAAKIDRL